MEEISEQISVGVSQGTILGSVLFNLYMSDIFLPLTASLALHADETVILCQHSDIDEAAYTLQSFIYTLVAWFDAWRFKINTTKCGKNIFIRKAHFTSINPNLQDVIMTTRLLKYLEMWLEKKPGLESLCKPKKLTRCYTRLSKLFRLINRKLPLNP